MIFDAPVDYAEALASSRARAVLPTELTTREIAGIAPHLREQARFSAQTIYGSHLSKIGDVIDSILAPQTIGGRVAGMDWGTARLALKDSLRSLGYDAGADAGRLTDLSSDARLNLVIRTGVEQAQGFGWWQQGQDPETLDLWPAQELFRAEGRKEPRDWPARWLANGGAFYDGRMIALKNDPIWVAISAFGLPYPPFDFGSGMDVRDVDREEAEAFGLISPHETVAPERREFSPPRASAAGLSPDMQQAILKSLGAGYRIDADGVLKRAA